MPGAVIALADPDTQSARTDGQGRFALGGVPSGFHVVRVHADFGAGAFSERVFHVFVAANTEAGDVKLSDAVTLQPIEVLGQTLRSTWTRAADSAFREYKLYRGTVEELDQGNGTLMYVSTNRDDTTFADDNLPSMSTFTYRVFLLNDYGRLSGSNPGSGTTAPRQLIKNGDFEDVSSINGWVVDWQPPWDNQRVLVTHADSTVSFEGKWSLLFQFPDNNQGYRFFIISAMIPRVEMVAGGTYRLSSRVLTDGALFSVEPRFYVGPPDGFTAGAKGDSSNVTPNSWSLIQKEFTLPTDLLLTGTDFHVTVYVSGAGPLTVWLDDARLVRVK